MKNIFYILIAAFSLLLHAKCVGQNNIVYGAGISYTNGVPTFVPPSKSARVAIDTVTSKWYEYATPGGWRWSGDRVTDISGCAAPAYTPGKSQSRLVLNACTEAQNGHGPELYKYTGSAWLCLNCGGNYTAGDGIDITGSVITNTGDLSNTNELQTLSVAGNNLTISDGNTVTLPAQSISLEQVPVILFIGESNSGGQSQNSALTITELSASKWVNILYNGKFKKLDIGSNNQNLHYNTSFTDSLRSATQHGWENGLNQDTLYGLAEIFLVKSGNGGSALSMWDEPDTFYRIFRTKILQAKRELELLGKAPKWIVWSSIGINDAIASTDTAVFRAKYVDWVNRVNTELGQPAKWICTRIMTNSAQKILIDDKLRDIFAKNEYIYEVAITGLSLQDEHHWSAASMKIIASRMGQITRDSIGLVSGYSGITTVNQSSFSLDTLAIANYTINQFYSNTPSIVGPWQIDWINLGPSTTFLGNGVVAYTSSNGWAVSRKKIKKTNFKIKFKVESTAGSSGVVNYIDEDGTGRTWASGINAIAGYYTFNSGIVVTPGVPATLPGVTISNGDWVSMEAAGENVVLKHGPDTSSMSTIYTFSNILSIAPDSIFIKSTSAVGGIKQTYGEINGLFSIGSGYSLMRFDADSIFIKSNSSPEGTFIAPKSTIFVSDTSLFIKKTSDGSVGWGEFINTKNSLGATSGQLIKWNGSSWVPSNASTIPNVWTTATRPTPASGEHPWGFNTTTGRHEGWDGTTWNAFY